MESSGLNTTANRPSALSVNRPVPPTPTPTPALLQITDPRLASYTTTLNEMAALLQEKLGTLDILHLFKTLEDDQRFGYLEYLRDYSPTVQGIFLKLYNLQDNFNNFATWPPAGYPADAPVLATLEGIHDEPVADSYFRVLRRLAPNKSLESVYTEITSALRAGKDSAKILSELSGVPVTPAYLSQLYETGRLVDNTILFNSEVQPDRFIGYFVRANSYISFLLDVMYNTAYGELSTVAFVARYIRGPDTYTIKAHRDQQYVVFLPQNKTFDQLKTEYEAVMSQDITDDLPVWVQLKYEFTKPPKGLEFYAVQGYRCRKWPHPELLVALAQGLPAMSPRAAAFFPEWNTPAGIVAWLDGVLREWKSDIRAMPVAEGYKQDIQMRLYNYVIERVEPLLEERMKKAAALGETYGANYALSGSLQKNRSSRLSANLTALAVAANTLDPNLLYQRTKNFGQQYANTLEPRDRNLIRELPARQRGWFAGESKESYRRTLKRLYGSLLEDYAQPLPPSQNTSRLDALTTILRDPTTNATAAWSAFRKWRDAEPQLAAFPATLDKKLANEIERVGPKGIFTSTTAYKRRLLNLTRRFQGLPTLTGGAAKTRAFSRKQMSSRRSHQRRSRKTHRRGQAQKGGATPMPLAYYQPGAQMLRTSADPTGSGLAATNATWARAPLPRQAGGWIAPPPSVMGAFVANGMRLMPVAAYMGYKQTRSSRRRTTNKRGKI